MVHRDAECKGAAARGPAGELRLRNVPREKIAAGVNRIRRATPLSPAIPRRRRRLSRPPVPCVRDAPAPPTTRLRADAPATLLYANSRIRVALPGRFLPRRGRYGSRCGARRGAPRDARTAAPATLGRYLTPLIRRRAVATADPGTGDHPRRRWCGSAAASAMLRAPQEAPGRSVRVVDRNQNPRCSWLGVLTLGNAPANPDHSKR